MVSTNPLVLKVLDKPAVTVFNFFPIPLVKEIFAKGFNNSDIITQQQT